ncbi:MAG: hypothetical protein LIO86_15390 [Lachnospiraceae bacterium]|nr:hypothetical protein [Lachnospiraceae bacterium]
MAELEFIDLTVDNLFDCCAVIDAVGAEQMLAAFDKDEIAALMKSGKDVKGVGTVIGMKICGTLLKNLPKARNEICLFFANCCIWDNGTKVTAEEIRKLKIGRFAQLIRDFFRKDDLSDFFTEVAGYLDLGQSGSENSSTEDIAAQSVT